ncbi:MAG: hypothetical protein GX051_03400 [Clostridiales bacterium]|nr:hypothetical protein [Clostridiales bacterium]
MKAEKGKTSCAALRRELKSQLRHLRAEYKKSMEKTHGESDEWLCDNYYILEREGRECVKRTGEMPPMPSGAGGLPRAYLAALDMCPDGVLPSQSEMIRILGELGAQSAELEYFHVLLKAALIRCACLGGAGKTKNALLLSNAVKSLRNTADIDFQSIVEDASEVEKIFSQDPSGVYPEMDDATKTMYRKALSYRARKLGISEAAAAEQVLRKASGCSERCAGHVGTYLGINASGRVRGAVFLVLEALLPLAASAVAAVLLKKWYILPLTYFPFWEIIKVFTDFLSMRHTSAAFLPRLENNGKVPDSAKTLITVSTLLPAAAKSAQLKKQLEQLWRTNGQQNVKICLLADLKGYSSPVKPQDELDVSAAVRVIQSLNKKYSDGFILAVRKREFSSTQEEYTGRERKRGAITQLIKAVYSDCGDFLAFEGDESFLHDIKYIFALDSDTRLPMDTAAQLVDVAEHPLNTPVVDCDRGIVTRGYGIFAPRVETDVASAAATHFSRLMAGDGGISLYENTVSDRYQDLFGESIFSGKGLINVRVFYELLSDTFDEERILSHDILEGSFLRTAFVSDIQITDGFPSRQGAYLDRLNRWVRGDWQNTGYIFRHVHLHGERVKNPLSSLSRFKLFDNLRRSFTPVAAAACLAFSAFMPARAAMVCIYSALLCTALPNIFAALRALFNGGPTMFSRLYYSGTMPVARACLLRAGVNIVMLAQTAYVCASGIFRALWRLGVSKKQLLQWTVAADSDRAQSLPKQFVRYLPSLIFGSFLLVFGSPFAAVCGVVFMLNFPYALFSGRKIIYSNEAPGEKQREKMLSCAAAMWRFYTEFCTQKDNWLPPDNVQETPVFRVAHRTSPTNIGLMLDCILAARDFGFIDSHTLYERVSRTLESVEKLETYKGNLLNWYSTETLRALHPKYVSTVDSGNFICSLVALRQGLLEYIGECPQLRELTARISVIINRCDISVFYNKRRKLFCIGIDLETGKASDSYYDLLMSEARMTGYYAVASRSVPKKHWGALGRTLASAGRYTGPVSWTGTMFEYFMPYIFIPAYRDTLGYEALRFCSWCQRRRVRGLDLPFGVSESGFYSFDAQLNYQYKANGVQKLGLKRALDSELVISPYSTFLLLPFQPGIALKNLEQLEKLQMTGRCGFYEAVDFTKQRVDNQDYAVVRSYMAHHIGMSMLSVCNALENNVMQKRFMLDEQMSAGAFMLQEKIPSGAVVFKDVGKRDVPKRSPRITREVTGIDDISPLAPKMRMLTNGEWTAFISDSGAGASLYSGLDITRRNGDLLKYPSGIFAFFKSENSTLPFTQAPAYIDGFKYSAEFSRCEATFGVKSRGVEVEQVLTVHPRLPSEQRRFTIKNNGRSILRGNLIIYFEPSLCRAGEEEAHRAFSKLFIKASYDPDKRLILFSRRSRQDGKGAAAAFGLIEKLPFTYELSRENVLERPYGISSIAEAPDSFTNNVYSADCCAAISVPVKIPPRQQVSVTAFLCAAMDTVQAAECALCVRRQGVTEPRKGAPVPFEDGSLESIIAFSLLPCVLFDSVRSLNSHSDRESAVSREKLWEQGISGDNKIIYVEVLGKDDVSRAVPYVRANRRLYRSGIKTDVIIGYREGGEYDTPVLSAVKLMLKKEDAQNAFCTDGGIFPINLKNAGKETELALRAAACFIAPVTGERLELPGVRFSLSRFLPLEPEETGENSVENGAYVIRKKPVLPWCFAFANKSFGTLVSDSSAGFSFAVNAHENKLTPWSNDTMSDNTGEMLLLETEGKIYSLTLGGRTEFSKDGAVWSGIADSISVRVRVSVPARGMKKNTEVEVFNSGEQERQVKLMYYTEPVLGSQKPLPQYVKAQRYSKGYLLYNAWNTAFRGGCMAVSCNGLNLYTTNRADVLSGKLRSSENLRFPDCAAVGKTLVLPAKRREKIKFVLSYGANSDAAMKIADIGCEGTCLDGDWIKTETPDKNLDVLVNDFLPSQIIYGRILARTGFYQCGGAWGFRDQLQDVISVLDTHPQYARWQILRSCAVQFTQGDVLHWWHSLPGGVRGVRTRYSDDLLWLVYACEEYVRVTGDESILDKRVYFLDGEPLAQGEHERYFSPVRSGESGSVYEHCIRAMSHSMRFGENGMPLIGGGDWNDGFNNVGINGRGESVWLAEFMSIVLEKAARLCEYRNDYERRDAYICESERLKNAVLENAWDGRWFRRAVYDDGSFMGSAGDAECEIDSLSQSFAVLCGLPDEEKCTVALNSAVEKLVDAEHGIIKLFSPAFTQDGRLPGYIASYPPGIRENGGQYTHAAVWLCLALIENGDTDKGVKLLDMINPLNRAQTSEYMTEPYALTGDVYSAQGMEGRGGWSLYTGSAGWYYSTVLHNIMGLRREGERLYVRQSFPSFWESAQARLSISGTLINIKYERSQENSLTVDGAAAEYIPIDGKEHSAVRKFKN